MMTTVSTLPANIKHALSGPYLTASSAYAAGFRGWPLVVMTAIAGRESGWQNLAPHTDSNGISSTGLWQINSSNVAGLSDPLTNARAAFAKAGGNTLKGLQAWALTPPGDSSLAGVNQPNPYPWGQIPPPVYAGYYDTSHQWHTLDYALTASQVAQAIYAYAQVQVFGAATQTELNGAGWGTVGQGLQSNQVDPSGTLADTSGAGGGCGVKGTVFTIPHTSWGPTYCNVKAFKGGLLVALGGAVLLFGAAMVVISGLQGKGPLAPVVSVAEGYMAGARKIPGVGRVASSTPAPGSTQDVGTSRAEYNRWIKSQPSRSESLEVNRKGGRPLKSVKSEPDPWEGQGYAENAA